MTSTVNYIKSNTSHPLDCPARFFKLDYAFEICEDLADERYPPFPDLSQLLSREP